MHRSLIPLLLVSLASCTESTTPPPAPPAKAVNLVAVSPTSQTAMVGSDVAFLPTVRATDSTGKAVAGVEVTFLISGGSRLSVFTGNDGMATLPAWTVSTVAGDNSLVTANADGLPQVTFTVRGIVGPPAQLISLMTDDAIGLAGNLLEQSPGVKVTDQYGNAITATFVTFGVLAGGGTVSPSTVQTDSLGVARTQWTLGQDAIQVMSARAGTLPEVIFRARSLSLIGDCQATVRLPQSGRIESTLSTASCQVDGKYQQTLVIDVPGPTAWRFNVSSPDFNTEIELRDMKGVVIGRGDQVPSTHGSTLRAILPSGQFQLIVSSGDANATGRYALDFTTVSTAARCGDAFVARGLTLTQGNTETCTANPSSRQIDRYRLHLEAGASIQLQLEDLSYDGPSIELRNEKGDVVATGKPNGFYVSILDFVADASGTYTIVVTAGEEEEIIVYTLGVR